MPFTDTDLTAIERAIAKGELEVEFADRRVRYRSIEELRVARSEILGALGLVPRPKQTRLYASKGL